MSMISAIQAQSTHIAYVVPAGTGGNQDFGGSLGMDFTAVRAIKITRLGCFDDLSDGLKVPISVRLYNRETQEVMASADFVPDDPGTAAREDGVLVGGSRFLPLTAPLNLPAGFQGSIVAEGYAGSERNGNRSPAPWTTDEGNLSIAFTGTARYKFPIEAGAWPDTPDGGPAARYAAGTFEFQTTAPPVPGTPVPTAAAGNGRIDLSWPVPTGTLAAANYRILRSDSPGGVFAQIAQIPDTTYAATGLTNGTLYCYKVVAVAANGQLGAESAIACARPVDLGANRLVAYDTPYGVEGNQDFGGALGMSFDVTNPVIIRQLGCFDDKSDGLFSEITIKVWNRDTQEEMATMVLSPDDPGTPAREDGTPVGGMRFKALPSALNLPIGFHGVISASGYGAMERNGNRGNPTPWTTRDGNGSIAFVGTSAYGVDPASFPGNADGGPAARYGAGTFIYETTAPAAPGTPVITAVKLNHAVQISWNAVLQPLPATSYTIYRADSDAGPFTLLGTATTTSYTDSGLENTVPKCYYVSAKAAGGQTSPPSATLCATPTARAAGIAYLVPEATSGNQAFGGALGMEFNVDRPVFITRLGAFDSDGDGITLPISVRLYNRSNGQALSTMTFAPGNDGELMGGSRFKNLPAPIALAAGFQGMIVASGYGDGERNGNMGGADLGLTVFDGGCLSFVGGGLYSVDPAGIANVRDGGPANRYAAGTFAFVPDLPPTGLTISRNPNGTVRLDWTDASGTLESTPNLSTGPWQVVPGATGLIRPGNLPREFFRLTR